MRVLVVEDDGEMAETVATGLRQAGMAVDVALGVVMAGVTGGARGVGPLSGTARRRRRPAACVGDRGRGQVPGRTGRPAPGARSPEPCADACCVGRRNPASADPHARARSRSPALSGPSMLSTRNPSGRVMTS
jgi:hypothetical protein